jgi:hypothetical protein
MGITLLLILAALSITSQPAKACVEGCTPGFWKNHPEAWPTFICVDDEDDDDFWGDLWHFTQGGPNSCPPADRIPISPYTPITAIFNLACLDADLDNDGDVDTLMDALNYGGGEGIEGKAQILLRIAVAELLNGMTQDHDQPFVTITMVNNAIGSVVYGACVTGNLGMMEYWATFWDDRVNSQPCIFDD